MGNKIQIIIIIIIIIIVIVIIIIKRSMLSLIRRVAITKVFSFILQSDEREDLDRLTYGPSVHRKKFGI